MEIIHPLFDQYFKNRRILLLGFGREGRVAYNFLRKYYPENKLGIADRLPVSLPEHDTFTTLHCGEDYLHSLIEYDLILKSPGISLPEHYRKSTAYELTSQTEIFLNIFSRQIIGITGTKGKSTTASLIYHLLNTAGRPALLGGNIGRPVLELVEEIEPATVIVLELSSHQLQYIRTSPHLAILLNVYPEHLDYYRSFEDYRQAKMNITVFQQPEDSLIYPLTEFLNIDSQSTKFAFLLSEIKADSAVIKFKSAGQWQEYRIDRRRIRLPGDHNLINIGAAVIAVLQTGIPAEKFIEGIYSFAGLKHRLQEVAVVKNIRFINDSISTIPETTIAALKVYNRTVESLIVGGHSRGEGISFKKLAVELMTAQVDNLFLLPETGSTVFAELLNAGATKINSPAKNHTLLQCGTRTMRCFTVDNFTDIINLVFKFTGDSETEKICLLSPAATSYNRFKNFEERGDAFIKAVLSSGRG